MFTKIGFLCLSVVVFSTFTLALVGGGTEGDPYQISQGSDFLLINDGLSQCYVMTNDIDLSDYPGIKIGINPSASFSGTFNGKGHTISNYTFDDTQDYQALFGHTSSTAIIKNVKMTDVNINAANGKYAAAVVGNNYGTVDMCEISGMINGGNFCAALVARNYGTITRSRAMASVISQSRGGSITSYNSSGALVSQSVAKGSVTAISRVGGIAGENVGNIANCDSSATVSGAEKVGGIAGSSATGEITNCYSTSFVSGDLYTGAFIGDRVSGQVLDSFFDNQTSNIALAVGRGASVGISGKTTLLMQTESTFTSAGWDFVNEELNGLLDLYSMPAGSYPRLYWETPNNGDINNDGMVDELDLYAMVSQWLLSSQEDQRLLADIDFNGFVDYSDFALLAEFWLVDDLSM